MKQFALNKIASVQQGYTFKPEYQGNNSGKWMYVKVGDLNSLGNIKYVTRTQNYINDDVFSTMKAKPFPASSIVFSRVGAALRLNNKRILAQDCLTDDNVLVITVTNKSECYPEFLYYWFESKDLQRFCNDGSVPVISGNNLKKQIVLLPSISEQMAVVSVLSTWDVAIEKVERIIAAKEHNKAALLQRFISLRAARNHWKTVEIGSVIAERNERSTFHGEFSVLTSSRRGLFLQSEYFTKQVTSENNAGYKIMHRGDFTFRSMSDDGRFVFNRLVTLDKGIISPAYGVFYATGVNADFLAHLINSSYFGQLLAREAQGGTRKALHFSALSNIEVDLPPHKEQQKIAAILNIACGEIDLLKKKASALRKQKRGLMQKLLTGEWRVKERKELVA